MSTIPETSCFHKCRGAALFGSRIGAESLSNGRRNAVLRRAELKEPVTPYRKAVPFYFFSPVGAALGVALSMRMTSSIAACSSRSIPFTSSIGVFCTHTSGGTP